MFYLIILLLFSHASYAQKSQCYGSASNGRLDGGVQLPLKGKNFIGYAQMGHVLGRNYVHSVVKDVVLQSYDLIALLHPSFRYKYAETGFLKGSVFKPHKTHQNGLSVDFMVPVKNEYNESVYFPTNLTNKYGYSMEFNEQGFSGEYQIDFEAMAVHILALSETAQKMGYGIKKVIFDPTLQKLLFNSKSGQKLIDNNVVFSKASVWVRHDEHYHVDFDVACSPMSASRHN